MHNVLGNPIKPVSRDIAGIRWLYIASIQRFWLDPIADRALVRPVQGLGRDLGYFDDHIVDRIMGTPARTSRAISSLVQLEKRASSSNGLPISSTGLRIAWY
jgi:hypothetical protein